MEIFTLIPLLRIACVEKRGVWRLKNRLFELASASEFRLFRLQTTVFQQVNSHAEKLLFFATLNKLLSLERESKLSLYSLTAVFFCGCKRKRVLAYHPPENIPPHQLGEVAGDGSVLRLGQLGVVVEQAHG